MRDFGTLCNRSIGDGQGAAAEGGCAAMDGRCRNLGTVRKSRVSAATLSDTRHDDV